MNLFTKKHIKNFSEKSYLFFIYKVSFTTCKLIFFDIYTALVKKYTLRLHFENVFQKIKNAFRLSIKNALIFI